jgi:DNA-binding IclR family transcriptional regulator
MPIDESGGDKPRLLSTVTLTCEILYALKEEQRAGVTDLAERLDLSKGAVYNHLATLHEQGLVVKKDQQYQLGLRFMNFGEFVKHQSNLLHEGQEETNKLAAETGEYGHLMELQDNRGFFVHRVEGENAVGDEYYSRNQEVPAPLYYTAAGKAALAFMNEEKIEQTIAERKLDSRTEHTIVDEDELQAELSDIRDQGYALNDEEQFLGLRAIGAPIRGNENRVIGSVSLSGPVSRISDEKFRDTLPEKVMETSNIIELNIKQQMAL